MFSIKQIRIPADVLFQHGPEGAKESCKLRIIFQGRALPFLSCFEQSNGECWRLFQSNHPFSINSLVGNICGLGLPFHG